MTEQPEVIPPGNANEKRDEMVPDPAASAEEQQEAHEEQEKADATEILPNENGENEALDDQAYEDYIDSLLDQLGDSDIG